MKNKQKQAIILQMVAQLASMENTLIDLELPNVPIWDTRVMLLDEYDTLEEVEINEKE